MSPELKRNLWLEFTGSRVVLMTSVLALVAIAVFLISGRHFAPLGPLGCAGFVFITIFWGSRNAARSASTHARSMSSGASRVSGRPAAAFSFVRRMAIDSSRYCC